jgi:hypothetical protein
LAAWRLSAGGAAEKPGTAEERRKLQDTLTALEKQTWEALRQRDAGAIRALWADDFVGVLASGVRRTRQEVLDTLPDLKITSASVDEVKLLVLDRDAALLTYTVTRKSTFKGADLAPNCYASSVWVRRGDRWRIMFYQETPVAAK